MSCDCKHSCNCVDPCSDTQIRRIVDDAVADRVEDMEDIASNAQHSAEDSATSASQSAQSAAQSQQFATTAGNNATSAAQSAQQAAVSATAAAQSATAAVQVTTGLKQVADELTDTATRLSDKVDGANQAAENAIQANTEAQAAASTASQAATIATDASTSATGSATLAQTSATNAQGFAATASTAATSASASETNASNSAAAAEMARDQVQGISTSLVQRQDLSVDSGAGLSGFSPKLTYLAGTLGAALKAQFQQGQSLQWYYDIYGDWNVAWEQAQLAVYIHGLSPKILFPNAQIEIKRPLLHGPALGDWIHKNYPMLNFYDEATGNYAATWPYIVEGVNPSGSDGAGKRNGSQIIFTGSKSRDDKTWMNFGIVHVAPTELDQFDRTAEVLKSNWPARVSHRFVNIMSKCQDGLSHANVHGMVIYHGTHCHIDDSNIYQCYGAGILFDWSYDSQVSRCAILQCGRMSPDWNKAVTDGNTGAEYQTYAPFHVMCSARGAENDNSNFIRLYGCQIEDNNFCNADIIVSGNSSPVWVRDTHFENAPVYGVKTGKTIAAIGNYGVSKFGDDSKSTYNYASRPNNLSGGSIVLEGGGMYSLSYSYLIQATRYSGYQILNWRWPNSGGIKVIGGNDSVEGFIFNSTVGDINYSGGNSSPKPLTMIGSECGNVTLDYTKGVVMKGVKGKALTVSNAITDVNAPFMIDGTFESANGILNYADCRLWLTSKTVPSSMRTTRGNVEIAYNAYQMNTLGLV